MNPHTDKPRRSARFAKRLKTDLFLLGLVAIPLLVALLLTHAPSAFANPFPQPAGSPDGYVRGQVIVRFRGGATAATRAAAVRAGHARVLQTSPLPGVRLLGVPAGESVAATVAALERDPAVLWAEPNAVREGGAVPNDPLFGTQWALHNTGQVVDDETDGALGTVAGAAGADIRAPEAWDVTLTLRFAASSGTVSARCSLRTAH